MSLGLRQECQKRLCEVLSQQLPQVVVEHGNLLQRRSTDGLRLGESLIPKSGPVRQKLHQYISETPVYDFVCETLSKELQETRPYESETGPALLTSLEDYSDPMVVAERLVRDMESLPWDYSLLVNLGSEVGQLIARGVRRFTICDCVALVTPDAEFAEVYPTRSGISSRDESLAPKMPLPYWYGFPPPLPLVWDQSLAHLQVKVTGFGGHYFETTPLQEATGTLKAFLGISIGLGLLTIDRVFDPIPATAQFVIHRHVSSSWVVERTYALSPSLSSGLRDLKLSYLASLEPVSSVKKALHSISSVFQQCDKARKLLLACQWLFDSYCVSNELLSFVETAVAMEILLGDKASSDLMGLGELLRNRCAYLIGTTHSERQEILADFKRIYDVRCDIVHAGKSRLSSTEWDLLSKLRAICARVIQAEVRLLENDAYLMSGTELVLPPNVKGKTPPGPPPAPH